MAAIDQQAAPFIVECQNCGWRGDISQGEECRRLLDRVEPGDRMPYCDCPHCGASCFPPDPAPALSACCKAVIGYDAWVDSTGEVCGGPYDNSQCVGCGKRNPEPYKAAES